MEPKDRKKLIAIIGLMFAIIGFLGAIPFMVNGVLLGIILFGLVLAVGMTMVIYGFSD